jgi:bacterioferritin
MLEDWGVTKLAKHEYKESIEEMQHADIFIKRILLLGGLPNLQELGKLMIGEDVKEVIECDLKLELDGIQTYREGHPGLRSRRRLRLRDLFLNILKDEELHADGLETQLKLINQMGLQNYIQLNSGPDEEPG